LKIVAAKYDREKSWILCRVVVELDVVLEARVRLQLRAQCFELFDAVVVFLLEPLQLLRILSLIFDAFSASFCASCAFFFWTAA
jgi:hypothetical protein